jgi:hypothetical protein
VHQDQGRTYEPVRVQGEDGRTYTCEIIEIFDFDDREYALLLKQGGDRQDPGSLLVVRVHLEGARSLIETIESDEEFERVAAYVEVLNRLNRREPS